jgi:hypothetical protein
MVAAMTSLLEVGLLGSRMGEMVLSLTRRFSGVITMELGFLLAIGGERLLSLISEIFATLWKLPVMW